MAEDANYTALSSFVKRCRAVVQGEIDLMNDWEGKVIVDRRAACRLTRRHIQDDVLPEVDDVQSKLDDLSGQPGAVKRPPAKAALDQLAQYDADLQRRGALIVSNLSEDDFQDALVATKQNAENAADLASQTYDDCVT